jgi:NAD(P)-dependent dehydrogenase (short-subunit alcohol dehydrogenase family)
MAIVDGDGGGVVGALEGRTALVAGGTGRVGGGIAGALLAEGARVVVPGRDAGRLAALRDRAGDDAGRLVTIEGDIADPEDAGRVRDLAGPLDAVAVAVGGWWSGPPLWEVDPGDWDAVLARNTRSHFVIARALMPGLVDRPGASWTAISGTAAEEPAAGSSLASVSSAATLMLTRNLAAEARQARVRVNALVLSAVRGDQGGNPEQLTAPEVGRVVAWLASDAASMVDGSVIRLPGRPDPGASPGSG